MTSPEGNESVATAAAAADETITTETGETAAQPTIEELAATLGWRAKEKLKDQSKYVDAAEYIKRTGKINKQYAGELNSLKKSVDGIMANFSQAIEQQYKRGIADAEAKYKEARENYDVDAMEQAQIEKKNLELELKQKQQANKQPPVAIPEVEAFIDRNKWFDKEPDMTADALAFKEQYLKANPGAEADKVLAYVERKIKREYPEYFEAAPAKTAPPTGQVEGARQGGQPIAGWQRDKKLLSEFEKGIMKATIDSTPGYTEQKYIETMRAQGALDGRN